jgi:tetratricopeptide (TPR) repeat protein
MFTTNVQVVRANVDYKQAKHSLQQLGQHDRAIELCRRALELEPTQDVYYSFLAKAMLEKATRATRPQEREALFREVQTVLMRARALNPLETGHAANLARLYHIWAQHTSEAAPRAVRLQNSLALYDRATTLSPHNVLLWNEWGATYAFMGDAVHALEKYQRSLALDDTFAPTYLHVGELYRAQGQWAEAAQAYEQAIARQPDSVHGHSALGAVYTRMGRVAEAVRQNHRVLDLQPNDLVSHRNLALLYRSTGQVKQALLHAQRALEVAPPTERRAAEHFIAQLRQQLANTGE